MYQYVIACCLWLNVREECFSVSNSRVFFLFIFCWPAQHIGRPRGSMCIISRCQVIGQVASGSAGEVHFMIFLRSQNFKSEVAVLCSRSTPYGMFYSRCGRVFPFWLIIGFGLSFEKLSSCKGKWIIIL